ncbi:Uncharacterised protein [uncultured Clostridium sp.]|jgi:hypothetical protein|nr:Uncharacterised protein [uncultured Clostridium sp.]
MPWDFELNSTAFLHMIGIGVFEQKKKYIEAVYGYKRSERQQKAVL